MTSRSREPVMGSTVNMTPERGVDLALDDHGDPHERLGDALVRR